ncbi:hypothetical protein RCO27_18700 [Sphingosinicella sp. LHD-64]|uniref:hypothetical protein n=1 Tax=Sphingosinicella sp. LHD-64 TaxID=3072139 RepID=UPI00280EBBFB|nr:hypothetical protein [Sphingosinicella sp. LHD-64]MDQ8758263.1 hypothetical protein [Sphingosinicella sp. LHD-64]
MTNRSAPFLRSAALAGLLALAACGGGAENNLAALDNALIANGADPALTSALEDQILVDPNLVQQAHPNSARPPETPVQAQYPADPAGTRVAAGRGGAASAQGAAATAGIGADLDYGPQWAQRLPAEFPPYPGARVTEAAGSRDARRLRVVTFRTADRADRVLGFYRSAVTRAGYDAEQQRRGNDQVLGGTNARTDGAYYLIVTPLQNGSDVALIVNNGR